MTDEELRQIPLALRGHAKWLRNYRESPRTYHDPLPMVPDQLDRIANETEALYESLMQHRQHDSREHRTGAHVLQTAKAMGWKDDGEGALEFMLRRSREVAFEDCGKPSRS